MAVGPIRRAAGRTRRLLAAAACLLVMTGACQAAPVPSVLADGPPVDDGTVLTMWTRSATASFSRLLIDDYNATHRNKVRLTVMPADSYQQRVGAAAGAGKLPDLVAMDVTYAPNYVSKGAFQDVTAHVAALPFSSSLADSHMRAATHGGRRFGVPHDIDLAALFYNKDLFIRAGLDGDHPPATLEEMYEYARKITGLGGDVRGFGFGGACPDCMLVTTWPMVWASGSNVLNADGTASTLDTSAAARVYELYRRMYREGLAPRSAKNESGPTWTQDFSLGHIGIQPMGATALQHIDDGSLQIGVGPIPGLGGGASSFVGGDILGISTNSEHPAQAWDFVSWTLSEHAQVEVVARNRNITVRSDLDGNVYAQQDPRLVTFTQLARQGQTPVAVEFGKTFSDPNGPWISAVTEAVFGSGDVGQILTRHNTAISASLAGG